MNIKSILLTGASGMLGSAMAAQFRGHQITCLSRRPIVIEGANLLSVDLTDFKKVQTALAGEHFDLVLHCAAETDVNRCEKDQQYAKKIHVDAIECLSETVPNAIFVYISTDAVFEGQSGNYTETSKLSPVNFYGISKLGGEEAIRKKNDRHYIFRTNIFGFHDPAGRSLFEWGYERLKCGESTNGYADVFFNPLYVRQLAELAKQAIKLKIPFGTYHAASKSTLSKFDFLKRIANTFGFAEELVLRTELNSTRQDVRRPLNTTLNTDKLEQLLDMSSMTIDNGFQMLKQDFNG